MLRRNAAPSSLLHHDVVRRHTRTTHPLQTLTRAPQFSRYGDADWRPALASPRSTFHPIFAAIGAPLQNCLDGPAVPRKPRRASRARGVVALRQNKARRARGSGRPPTPRDGRGRLAAQAAAPRRGRAWFGRHGHLLLRAALCSIFVWRKSRAKAKDTFSRQARDSSRMAIARSKSNPRGRPDRANGGLSIHRCISTIDMRRLGENWRRRTDLGIPGSIPEAMPPEPRCK